MQKKMSIIQKMAPIFSKYQPIMSKLLEVGKGKTYKVDYWTPLKIYCLASYIHTCYTKIISNNVTDNFYFIDLMSSCGVNKTEPCRNCDNYENQLTAKECKVCKEKERPKINFVGSTILAASSEPPFKKIYFVDKDKDNIQILSERLEIAKNTLFPEVKYMPICGDCNEKIDAILEEITKTGKYHFLAFADNEGLNIKWKTIEKLLGCYSDLIINFPTSNIRRSFYQPDTYETRQLNDFFGCDIRKQVGNYSELLNFYVEKIKHTKKNMDVEMIHIETNCGFYYDLLIVAKQGKYWNYIKALKKEIEHNSAGTIETVINVIMKKQATLFG